MFSVDAARNATPAPAKVILLVEANRIGRFGLPDDAASDNTSTDLVSTSVRWCSA